MGRPSSASTSATRRAEQESDFLGLHHLRRGQFRPRDARRHEPRRRRRHPDRMGPPIPRRRLRSRPRRRHERRLQSAFVQKNPGLQYANAKDDFVHQRHGYRIHRRPPRRRPPVRPCQGNDQPLSLFPRPGPRRWRDDALLLRRLLRVHRRPTRIPRKKARRLPNPLYYSSVLSPSRRRRGRPPGGGLPRRLRLRRRLSLRPPRCRLL
mmetsp:Transcript_32411/g.103333  ORF Transcript_32411/g.103333 Transcript_32411/m.103333 type:complete len:208 (+) Transcript_32411:793-1416(+)